MGRRGRNVGMILAGASLAVSSFGVPTSTFARERPHMVVRNGTTQPVFSYREAVRETVYVQGYVDQDLDGRLDLLATDIIRPKESNRGLKVPVIYEQSPYYQSLGRGNEAEVKAEEDGDFTPTTFPLFYDNYFVPRGYAFIAQDMRGTRNSEGCMVLGGEEEEQDAVATIDWLNGRNVAFTADGEEVEATWSSGKVGMIGKSYDGSVANGAASTGVEGLETIVPIGAIGRWYDYHLNKGTQYVNAYLTPGLFVFMIDQTPGDDEERGLHWVQATFGENGPCTVEGASIVAQAADPRGDYNAFWDHRDYLKDAARTEAAVFVVHGLNDWNVKPNNWEQWWTALAANDVPRKLWLTQTGHVDPFDFRRAEWVKTLHRWYDHWLHGIDNGIMREPMVDIERDADDWHTYDTWPARGTRRVKVFLREKKDRRPGFFSLRRAVPQQVQTYSDGLQGEGAMVSEPFGQKDTRLMFLSNELKKRVRLSGAVKVRLRAAVNQVDTNFTALLVDYGKAERVDHEGSGEGIETLSKEDCWGSSTKADDACYRKTRKLTHVSDMEIVSRGWLDARHHAHLRRSELLVPGRDYRFAWKIFGEDYIFERGHRIGIVIAGSDTSWTIPDPLPATVDVLLRRSNVRLPVVGGAAALWRAGALD